MSSNCWSRCGYDVFWWFGDSDCPVCPQVVIMACREFEMGKVGFYCPHTKQLSHLFAELTCMLALFALASSNLIYRQRFTNVCTLHVYRDSIWMCAVHFFFSPTRKSASATGQRSRDSDLFVNPSLFIVWVLLVSTCSCTSTWDGFQP